MTTLWSVCVVMIMIGVGVRGESVVVKTEVYGSVRGSRTRMDQHVVDVFLGLPYASPPLGDLRFQKPIPPKPWTGIRDATQFGPKCPQSAYNVTSAFNHLPADEDCLYLNLYVPRPANNYVLPVMVFIHGGGYFAGSGSIYNGTYLATKQVLLVTMNYRLGALGFLSTEDAASIGNYGLWDQLRALRWIQEVISDFNGDPNDVTVFGQSAGSGSVSLLLQAEESVSLFHKAIMESGVSVSPWAVGYPGFEPTPKALAVQLASHLGCPKDNSTRLVACLRTKDAMAIVNVSAEMMMKGTYTTLFKPVSESSFGQRGLFSDLPRKTLINRGFYNIPTIRGFNHDEVAVFVHDPDDTGVTLQQFEARVMNDMSNYYKTASRETLLKIQTLLLNAYVYQPNITHPKALRQAMIDYMTDFYFGAPTVSEISLAMNNRDILPQYLYRFSYTPTNKLGPRWEGAIHGSEIPFVFGSPFFSDPFGKIFVSNWTDQDRHVADQIMTLWTNFVIYGVPTFEDQWQPWTNKNRYFMEINTTNTLKTLPVSPQDAWTAIYALPDNPDVDMPPDDHLTNNP